MNVSNAGLSDQGKIGILDATLREGEQAPGVYFEPHVKAVIAGLLDEIGVEVIEAGHPVVGDEIGLALKTLTRQGFRARIGAHARARRVDVEAALESGANFLGIFLCVSRERLQDRGMTLGAALADVAESVSLAKERRPDITVRFTPEDSVRSPLDNVAAAASVAVDAGADIISIADTTGCMIPGSRRSLYDWLGHFRDELSRRSALPRIAVHCHNDRGLALANALDGLRAGASIIDASVLGLGERAGIVDLGALLAVLSQDFTGSGHWRLDKVAALYGLVSRFSGVPIPAHFPVMGRYAFSHCAGVHSQAALLDPRHYQSLDPAPFGLCPEFILDHMSGRAALKHALDRIVAGDLDQELVSSVLRRVKSIGRKGRTVGFEELGWIVAYEKAQAGGHPALRARSA